MASRISGEGHTPQCHNNAIYNPYAPAKLNEGLHSPVPRLLIYERVVTDIIVASGTSALLDMNAYFANSCSIVRRSLCLDKFLCQQPSRLK
eukprot:scaffold232716_cov18-Prasinocladus_malaysianus.AAC.1